MSRWWQYEWADDGNMNEPMMAIWMSRWWQYEWADDGNMNETEMKGKVMKQVWQWNVWYGHMLRWIKAYMTIWKYIWIYECEGLWKC